MTAKLKSVSYIYSSIVMGKPYFVFCRQMLSKQRSIKFNQPMESHINVPNDSVSKIYDENVFFNKEAYPRAVTNNCSYEYENL